MTHPPLPRRRRARGWGIASSVAAVLAILPVAIVMLLVVAVDEQYGWGLIVALLPTLACSAIAVALGVVGIVLGAIDRVVPGWAIAGALVGGGIIAFLGVAR